MAALGHETIDLALKGEVYRRYLRTVSYKFTPLTNCRGRKFIRNTRSKILIAPPLRRRGVIIFLTVQGRTTHSIYPLDINSFSPYRDSCL